MSTEAAEKISRILQSTVVSICQKVVDYNEELVVKGVVSVEADGDDLCTVSFSESSEENKSTAMERSADLGKGDSFSKMDVSDNINSTLDSSHNNSMKENTSDDSGVLDLSLNSSCRSRQQSMLPQKKRKIECVLEDNQNVAPLKAKKMCTEQTEAQTVAAAGTEQLTTQASGAAVLKDRNAPPGAGQQQVILNSLVSQAMKVWYNENEEQGVPRSADKPQDLSKVKENVHPKYPIKMEHLPPPILPPPGYPCYPFLPQPGFPEPGLRPPLSLPSPKSPMPFLPLPPFSQSPSHFTSSFSPSLPQVPLGCNDERVIPTSTANHSYMKLKSLLSQKYANSLSGSPLEEGQRLSPNTSFSEEQKLIIDEGKKGKDELVNSDMTVVETASGEKLYRCNICYKAFTFSTNLTRHQRNLHGKPHRRRTKEMIKRERETGSSDGNDSGVEAVRQRSVSGDVHNRSFESSSPLTPSAVDNLNRSFSEATLPPKRVSTPQPGGEHQKPLLSVKREQMTPSPQPVNPADIAALQRMQEMPHLAHNLAAQFPGMPNLPFYPGDPRFAPHSPLLFHHMASIPLQRPKLDRASPSALDHLKHMATGGPYHPQPQLSMPPPVPSPEIHKPHPMAEIKPTNQITTPVMPSSTEAKEKTAHTKELLKSKIQNRRETSVITSTGAVDVGALSVLPKETQFQIIIPKNVQNQLNKEDMAVELLKDCQQASKVECQSEERKEPEIQGTPDLHIGSQISQDATVSSSETNNNDASSDCVYKCALCDNSFTGTEVYKDHLRNHSITFDNDADSNKETGTDVTTKVVPSVEKTKPSQGSVCKHCGLTFQSHSSYKRHVKSVHGKSSNKRKEDVPLVMFPCELCGQSFYNPSNLHRHLVTSHGQSGAVQGQVIPEGNNQPQVRPEEPKEADTAENHSVIIRTPERRPTPETEPNRAQVFSHIKEALAGRMSMPGEDADPMSENRPPLQSYSPKVDRSRDQVPSFNPRSPRMEKAREKQKLNLFKANSPKLDRIPKSPKLDRMPGSPKFDRMPKSPCLDRMPRSPSLDRMPSSPKLDRFRQMSPKLDRPRDRFGLLRPSSPKSERPKEKYVPFNLNEFIAKRVVQQVTSEGCQENQDPLPSPARTLTLDEYTENNPNDPEFPNFTLQSEKQRHLCNICGATFTFQTNLTRHQRKIHGKPFVRRSPSASPSPLALNSMPRSPVPTPQSTPVVSPQC